MQASSSDPELIAVKDSADLQTVLGQNTCVGRPPCRTAAGAQTWQGSLEFLCYVMPIKLMTDLKTCCRGTLVRSAPTQGPRLPRHLASPPMPSVVPDYAGRLEVPENIESWKGSIFSIYSKEVADWEGSGYGALLQTPAVRPSGSELSQ